MKLFTHLLFVLICFSYSCVGALPDVATRGEVVGWTEVHNISFITKHAETSQRGVFMLDADETLFTTAVVEGVPTLVRLHKDLEGVLASIKRAGHDVYVLTYNTEEEVLRKLITVQLDAKAFDGILACGMKGDLMTAKGELLRRHVSTSKTRYDFAVFIDNFPPFVKNVQSVALELGLRLHSYLCTGYIDLYHPYVYHHLSKLQKDSAKGGEVSHELTRITKSLVKYGIEIARFTEQYPTYESFKEFADREGLIWPYLTYL